MIAALALRWGVASWLLELLLLAALCGAGVWYHGHVFHQGEVAANDANAIVAKANSDRADAERDKLNGKVRAAQSLVTAGDAKVAQLETRLLDEKAISVDLQRDLSAGRKRLSILTRARPVDPNGPPGGPAAGQVNQGAGVIADIDPGVASNLERFRSDYNSAVERLNMCIVRYDTVRAAAEAMP